MSKPIGEAIRVTKFVKNHSPIIGSDIKISDLLALVNFLSPENVNNCFAEFEMPSEKVGRLPALQALNPDPQSDEGIAPYDPFSFSGCFSNKIVL